MYIKNLTRKIDIRISDEKYDKLCEIAAIRKIKVSELIRYIISDYLRKF